MSRDLDRGAAGPPSAPSFADALARVGERGAHASLRDVHALITCRNDELPALLHAAGALRDRHKGRHITYSRKVFLPITNICRDRCSYCTFRKDPEDPGAWTMQRNEIRDWLTRAEEQGCKEALMCLGDTPEAVFPAYRDTLSALGHRSTVDYVREA